MGMNASAANAKRVDIGRTCGKDIIAFTNAACINKFEIKAQGMARLLRRLKKRFLGFVARFRWAVKPAVNMA